MNPKALTEQREDLQNQLDALVSTAETENRAMTAEEAANFDRIEGEIRAIDETLNRSERARNMSRPAAAPSTQEERAQSEERAFVDYIMGRVSEQRAGEQNLTMGDNGAVVPVSIANRIITAVHDRCPILAGATIYHVKGTLKVPVWGDADGHNITVGYAEEFRELTADAGKFISVDLGGFLGASLTLLSKSLQNNADIDVLDFIVDQMTEAISLWIEGQLLTGTGTNACQGALNTTNEMVAAAATTVTADELIDLQAKVKQAFQRNACWTMHPDTFTIVKKLKDGNGRYLLQDDITGEFPYRLLGRPVHLSDNMPKMEKGNRAILYGDYKGLSVNIRENINIQVLREKYATQHAIGVVAWFELDSRITDNQRLAVLKMKAT